MSTTEKIGLLWQSGEAMAQDGKILDAVLEFQRAKSILVVESNNFSSQNHGRIPPVLGQIMEKLTKSIDKAVDFLHKNPYYTLGLSSKQCTQKEVKRAYKRSALKYHPDKNGDCDSSCIFAAIQSAYEKVLPSALPNKDNDAESRPSSAATKQQPAKQPTVPAKNASNKATSRNQTQTNHTKSSTTSSTKNDSTSTSHLSNEQLRSFLSKLGFERLDTATREELVKKYLAIKAHFSSTNQKSSDDMDFEFQGDINNLEEKFRKELHTRKAKEEKERHQAADFSRKVRVEELKRMIPTMTILELRRMMLTCGISTVGCLEKDDLIRSVCAHFGISDTDFIDEATSRRNIYEPNEWTSSPRYTPDTNNNVNSNNGKPPKDCSGSTGQQKASIWTKDKIKSMEDKLFNNSRRKRPDIVKPKEREDSTDDFPMMKSFGDINDIKPMNVPSSVRSNLADYLKRFDSNSIPSATSVGASFDVNSDDDDDYDDDDDDDDDDAIDFNFKKESVPQESSLDDNEIRNVKIPSRGLGNNSDGDGNDDDDSDDSYDEVTMFLNFPDISPAKLKEIRMNQISKSNSFSSKVNQEQEIIASPSQQHSQFTVGINLLKPTVVEIDDDYIDSDDSDDSIENCSIPMFTPKASFNAASATAWNNQKTS